MTDLLRIENLVVTFPTTHGSRQAVRNLSFSLGNGKTLGIVGESGSGKTTAGRAILRLLPASALVSGRAMFDGQDLVSLAQAEYRRLRWREISVVPQAAMNSLDPVRRVEDQLAEAVIVHENCRRRSALARAREALRGVGIDPVRGHDYPHQFSGGMRQRALIALATILSPRLLIADEATTGLDLVAQDRVLSTLDEVRATHGLSVLFITHDLALATEFCDELLVMKSGRGLECATTGEIIAHPKHPYTRELFSETRAALGEDRAWEDRVRSDDDGSDEPIVVQVDKLGVDARMGRGLGSVAQHNRVSILQDVSFKMRRGELVGLAGESGAGKSTVASVLNGLSEVARGDVQITGASVQNLAADGWRLLRRKAQPVFQDPFESLNPRFTVRRLVAEPVIAQHETDDSEILQRRIIEALSLTELLPPEEYLDRYPSELSGGERQRISIARALITHPKVIVADEPVSMLDYTTANGIARLFKRLCRETGVCVLLISHDVSLLASVCDRIGVMYLGRVIEMGPAQAILQRPSHPYTRHLISAIPTVSRESARRRSTLTGEAPSLLARPDGCPFHTRCERAEDRCRVNTPELSLDVHAVACHFPVDQGVDPARPRVPTS